ncbi:MAG: NUDIX domain-containing protein [Rhodocyclaceae bacterium]
MPPDRLLANLLDDLLHTPPPDFLSLCVAGGVIGHVAPCFAERVSALAPELFQEDGPRLRLAADVRGDALTRCWAAVVARLREEGWFAAWRGELYDVWLDGGVGIAENSANTVDTEAGGVPLCQLERGVFRRFGLRSRAVHLNAVTPDGRMWIARRAASKAIDPGRLDNLVGGGVGSGESPQATLLRECSEEAGIPPDLAARARHQARLHACRPETEGLHDEWLDVFELVVPDHFRPVNRDGEVAEFMLMAHAEVCERILAGDFTVDAAAVAAWHLLER